MKHFHLHVWEMRIGEKSVETNGELKRKIECDALQKPHRKCKFGFGQIKLHKNLVSHHTKML